MANVFSDVFEAIRTIRQRKGTKETDIMTYVHDRLGKGVSIRTVLKTMKTLNRLVDDGLLIKKGCRYLLPLPSDSGQEKNQNNGDKCMEDEDNGEDEGEGEEDENEGVEDEDDDDDDDDDDDGGTCNMNKKDTEGKDNGNGDRRIKKDHCKLNEDVVEHRGRRNEDAELNYKQIDSKMKKYMKSELNPVAGSFLRSKKQRHRARRYQISDEEYDDTSQTQSPVRESSDEMMDAEEGLLESKDEAQFINSDISFEYEKRDRPEGHNEYRYKSPNGPPPPNTPGVHVERRESCCSGIVPKVDDLVEDEPEAHGDAKSKQPGEGDKKEIPKDRQPKRRVRDEPEEGCKKEKAPRRDDSLDEPKDGEQTSICELCKKKKLPGCAVDCSHNEGNW